uniref:Pentacotripeptide-repeat region of PRORP domain-containing protein n=1 Tax=Oryza glaberrima TaxID=4538 RepID=I1QC57_ORYGL
MHRAVPGFLRRALITRNHPQASRFTSLACCLNNLDHQEPTQSTISGDYRRQCLLPLITLAVRTSNWDAARKISFRECERLYGLSQSIGLFALLIQSFLPRRVIEVRCLIQSIVDYCGNAGPELFELALMLVNNLGGSITLLQVYAALIRVFIELSMFEDALVTYIEAKKIGVELQLCNFLLKSLVKRNQFMYARSLFDDMKSTGPSPNVYSYSVLMSMYTHGDKPCLEEAFDLLCEMKIRGVKPTAATYGTYLYGLCRAKQIESAWDFLQVLRQRGYPCNSYCFNAVIHGFCNDNQVHKAMEVFDEMKKGAVVPDVHSYSILVDALCKQGALSLGSNLLDEMERNRVSPTLVIYSSLLHGLCKAGKVEEALELFERLKYQGFKHDQITYSIVLHGCCRHMDIEVAYGLWIDMVNHNFVPDVYNYTSLIYAFCRHRYLKEALGLFELMLDNKINPNIITCTILVDGFMKEGLISEAFLFLDEVRQFDIVPNLYTYKVIINGLFKGNESDDLWGFFGDMIKRGYIPDVVLYSIIIDGFVKALDLQEAFRLYHKMLDEGTMPNIFTYTSLINGLCHDDRLPEMTPLLKNMILGGLTPDRIMYTSLIACYCKRSNMKKAMEIFREMKNGGISPDTFVYTCLIGGYTKVRAMDFAELLMEEMETKGLTPTVVTYTDLIIGYLKTGDEKSAYRTYHNMIQRVSCVYGCCWVTKVGGSTSKFLWMPKDVKSQNMWNGGAFWLLQESRLQGSDPIVIRLDASTVNAVLADLFSSVDTLTKSPPLTHEEEDDLVLSLHDIAILILVQCSFIGDDFLINTIGPAGKEKVLGNLYDGTPVMISTSLLLFFYLIIQLRWLMKRGGGAPASLPRLSSTGILDLST